MLDRLGCDEPLEIEAQREFLELVNNRLDKRPLAQEQRVGEGQLPLRIFLRSLVMSRSP